MKSLWQDSLTWEPTPEEEELAERRRWYPDEVPPFDPEDYLYESMEVLHRSLGLRREHGFPVEQVSLNAWWSDFSTRDRHLLQELQIKMLERSS